MKGLVVFIIFLSLQAHAESSICKFENQGREFFSLLQQSCEAFIDYCQNFSEHSCLERINSLEATRNHRERSSLIYISNQKLTLANNIFSTVSLDKTSIKEVDIQEYESKLNILDGLSRHDSPLIKEFILDLKNSLQAHWMAEYFHAWSVWQNLNNDLFLAGLPLSLISGQIALYNIKDSGVFTKFLNQTLPGKLFSLSTLGFRLTTPYITLEAVKATNRAPVVMPLSPAHFIRFDYQNYAESEIEAFISSIQKNQTYDQIRTGIVISSLFLLGDLHISTPQVYPKWIPNWAQSLMKVGAISPSPATSKKWSLNPKNLIRLTPQSLAAGVVIDQGVSRGIKAYTEKQVDNQVLTLLSADTTEDQTVNNARELMKTLAELDIFYTKDRRESYFLNRDFIMAVQFAIENQLPLTSFMDEYFYDHTHSLKTSGIEMVRYLSCASQRDINYLLVGRREVYRMGSQFLEKRESYLSSLWTYSELLSSLLNSRDSSDIHPLMREIVEGKIKHLQVEHAITLNENLDVDFKTWTHKLYNEWFKPVAEYSAEKKRRDSSRDSYGQTSRPSAVHGSKESSLQSLAIDNLAYCQILGQ